jgi:hypothetical protein
MKNLHLLKVIASSGEEAIEKANKFAQQWCLQNKEHKVKSINSAISEHDEIHGQVHKNFNSIEKINNSTNYYINSDPEFVENINLKLSNGDINLKEWGAFDLFYLKQYVDLIYRNNRFKNLKFDVLKHSYFENEYNTFGITSENYSPDIKTETDKLWVVFIELRDISEDDE